MEKYKVTIKQVIGNEFDTAEEAYDFARSIGYSEDEHNQIIVEEELSDGEGFEVEYGN